MLSPAEGWGLRGFTRTSGHGSGAITQRAKLSYSGVNKDGIPLVQSIEAETLAGKSSIRQETIGVSKIKFGDPDDHYFGSYSF